MTDLQKSFMKEAIKLSVDNVVNGTGGPFGAVVVKDGKIVGRGYNQVTTINDPTAHAEVMAIRDACKNLDSFQLDGCEIYTSCEPCPMCLGAIYWARPSKVYYGNTKADAADIGFDDDFIYKELELDYADRKMPFEQMMRDEAMAAFNKWTENTDKVEY